MTEFTNSERKVARFILAEKQGITNMTILDIAQGADVSEASVMRFCSKLGIRKLIDLRIQIAKDSDKVQREQRRKNGIAVGSLTLDDLIYIRMWSPSSPEHEPIVWYGPGAQWNTTDGIRHANHYNNILFGVYSPEGSGWYMAGGMSNLYMHKNGAGTRDTRILRFKKSDVEYIY